MTLAQVYVYLAMVIVLAVVVPAVATLVLRRSRRYRDSRATMLVDLTVTTDHDRLRRRSWTH